MSISISSEDLERLERKYGDELTLKAVNLIKTYTNIVTRDAKEIINDEGYRDTGRLINSIKPSLKVYATKVAGEVNAGTEYARFIHEGAEHEGNGEITSHFVPFSVAPKLLAWAKRHNIIKNIRGNWYFIDKDNNENLISDINKSGMRVYTRPTKFFEKPFEAIKEKFVEEMSLLVGGKR